MPNVPYPYEVNWHLVTGNGSLIQICSLSNSSLLPSLIVVCFLKLGPIFVNLWSSEPKSNHKNNKLAPILGQKSLFGGLCNGVRQKWGHASFLGLIWTEAFRCSRFVWIFSSKVSTVNTDSSLENNWLEDLWTNFLALSFFFLCIDRL